MRGAREYAELFSTGQHGRLYLVSGSHARGKTFHIYVTPAGAAGSVIGGLPDGSVEVYGITGGQPGWTETYGWLHQGKWQHDFAALVQARRDELAAATEARAKAEADANAESARRNLALLQTYS